MTRSESALARAAKTDTRFFQANPDRRHRLRPAHPAEIALATQFGAAVHPGMRLWTAIAKVDRRTRARVFMLARADKVPRGDEDEAREVFERGIRAGTNPPTFH
jgi:hypothetical protein